MLLLTPGQTAAWRDVLFLLYLNNKTCSPERPLATVVVQGGNMALDLRKRREIIDWIKPCLNSLWDF